MLLKKIKKNKNLRNIRKTTTKAIIPLKKQSNNTIKELNILYNNIKYMILFTLLIIILIKFLPYEYKKDILKFILGNDTLDVYTNKRQYELSQIESSIQNKKQALYDVLKQHVNVIEDKLGMRKEPSTIIINNSTEKLDSHTTFNSLFTWKNLFYVTTSTALVVGAFYIVQSNTNGLDSTHVNSIFTSIFDTLTSNTHAILKSIGDSNVKTLTELNINRDLNAQSHNITQEHLNSIARMIHNLSIVRDKNRTGVTSGLGKPSFDSKDWSS